MTKKKVSTKQILQENKQRLELLESLLNFEGKKVENVSQELQQHLKDADDLVKQYHAGNLDMQRDMKMIHDKLDQILNIKVNGSIGLENVLKTVYEATSAHRTNKALRIAFNKWIESHKTLKTAFNSQLIKNSLAIVIVWLMFSILRHIGFTLDPIDIIRNILHSL